MHPPGSPHGSGRLRAGPAPAPATTEPAHPGRLVPALGAAFALGLAALALVGGSGAAPAPSRTRQLSLELSTPPLELELAVEQEPTATAAVAPAPERRRRRAEGKAPPPAPHAWADVPSTPLSPEAEQDPAYRLRTALAGIRPVLSRCYEKGLRVRRSAGRLSLSLDIDPEGRVSQVRVLDDTLGDELVLRCVVARIRTARLPALGKAVVAEVPLLLVPLDS